MQGLKQTIASAFQPNKVPFSHDFLNKGTSTSKDFLNDITFGVELQQLYKVVDTTINYSDATIVSILYELVAQEIRDQYENSKYLLQAWYKNEVIYEVALNHKPKYFFTVQSQLCFMPAQGDEGAHMLHILDQEHPKNILKISNIATEQDVQFMCLETKESGEEARLAWASNHWIKAISFPKAKITEEGATTIDASKQQIRELKFQQKILQLIFAVDSEKFMVVFETGDNQLEFNYLDLDNINEEFTYALTRYTEILSRGTFTDDPISKLWIMFRGYYSYAITQRISGYFDIYWDCQRKDSSKYRVLDIEMSSDTFYVKAMQPKAVKQEQPTGLFGNLFKGTAQPVEEEVLLQLNHGGESNISCDQFERVKEGDVDFDGIKVKDSLYHVQLVTAIQTSQISHKVHHHHVKESINDDEEHHGSEQEDEDNVTESLKNVLLICHNSFISVYDALEHKWLQHFIFKEGQVYDLFEIDQNGTLKFGIFLNNGQTYLLTYDELKEKKVITKEDVTYEIEGELNGSVYDPKKEFALIITSHEETLTCHAIDAEEKFYKLEGLDELTSEAIFVVPVHQSPDKDKSRYIIVQDPPTKVTVYKLVKSDEEEEEEGEGEEKKEEEADEKSPKKKQEVEHGGQIAKKVAEFPGLKDIESNLHSAFITDIKENIILIDNEHLYSLDVQSKKLVKYAEQYIESIKLIDEEYLYALCLGDPDKGRLAGLRIYFLPDIISNKRCKSVLVNDFDVGHAACLLTSSRMDRIVYTKSLTTVEIVPKLHQNSIRFMGIRDHLDYLAVKKVGDTFVALDKDGLLQSWCMMTGKIIKIFQTKGDIAWDKYSKTTSGFCDRQLIRSNSAIEGHDYRDFYEPWQYETKIENQKNHIERFDTEVYEMMYIEIVSMEEVKIHMRFKLPQGDLREIYINNDMTRLIRNHYFEKTYLYQITETGNNTKFKFITRLMNYPEEAELPDDVLQCYSPDFSQYLYIDKRDKSFIIKDSITNVEICKIDKEIMFLTTGKKEDIQGNIKRFKWIDNQTFKIVNTEGFEKIVDYRDGFKELTYNKVPEFLSFRDDWVKGCFYFYKDDFPATEVLKLLKRQYQTYKSAYYLDKLKTHSEFYQTLITFDIRKIERAYHSFTFLDWKLIEQICDEEINIPDIYEKQIERMLFNILPGGQNILHMLTEKEQSDDIEEIFKRAKPNPKNPQGISIPIIPDFDGETPLHIANRKGDMKAINLYLKYMQDKKLYDIEHHSRAIKDLIPIFIEKEVPELLAYLDSRVQQTKQSAKIKKGALLPDSLGIVAGEAWFNKHHVVQHVMDLKSKEETRLKCSIIDLPEVYHYNDKQFDAFYGALANTEWYDVFTKPAIQTLINYNYDLVKEYTIKKLFVPYCFFMIFYMFYFNLVKVQYDTILAHYDDYDPWVVGGYYMIQICSIGVLGLFGTYFIKNEVSQLVAHPIDYFSSFWNYVDVIPVAGIYTMITFQIYPWASTEVQIVVQSITTFIMWMKVLYFLRIFKSTGYFLEMIFKVIIDIKYFLLVLFIVIFAFGDAMFVVSYYNSYKFTSNITDSFTYTYRMILGDWSTDDFDGTGWYMTYIFFMLCTFFNMIIMLNLLISIVSEAFNKVNSNAENAAYKGMAQLVAENNYLVPDTIKRDYSKEGVYLIVFESLDKDSSLADNPLLEQFQLSKLRQDELKAIVDKQGLQINRIETAITKVFKHLLPDEPLEDVPDEPVEVDEDDEEEDE